jgi:WD40 repeat protein
LWEVDTGNPKMTLGESARFGFLSVAFSPDGKMLAGGTVNGGIYLWETRTGKRRETVKRRATHRQSNVRSMRFFPDGKTLATGTGREIWFWDIETGKRKRAREWHGSLHNMVFSPDGKTLVGRDPHLIVRLREALAGTHNETLEQHGISSMAYSPDDSILASGSEEGTILLWERIPTTK